MGTRYKPKLFFLHFNISHGNVDLQKSASTQPFSQKILMGTVGSILTKIIAYFEDKTISKKKTSALLLYAQMEHDTCNKNIMQEQQDLLHVFVYYDVSFKQHPVLLIVPRRYFCGGSYCFISWCLRFFVLLTPYIMLSYFS